MGRKLIVPPVLHHHRVVQLAVRVRPDRQRHGPSPIREPRSRPKIPGPRPVPDPVHRHRIRDHERVHEPRPIRALDPNRNLRPEIRMRPVEPTPRPRPPKTIRLKPIPHHPTSPRPPLRHAVSSNPRRIAPHRSLVLHPNKPPNSTLAAFPGPRLSRTFRCCIKSEQRERDQAARFWQPRRASLRASPTQRRRGGPRGRADLPPPVGGSWGAASAPHAHSSSPSIGLSLFLPPFFLLLGAALSSFSGAAAGALALTSLGPAPLPGEGTTMLPC